MSANTISLPSAPVVTAAPRGAAWAADLFANVLRGLRLARKSLMQQHRQWAEGRAAHEMLRLANTYSASQPAFAAELRSAAARLSDTREQ